MLDRIRLRHLHSRSDVRVLARRERANGDSRQLESGTSRLEVGALRLLLGLFGLIAATLAVGGAQAFVSAAHWIKVTPGKGVCAHGGRYAFWVHSGSGRKLLFYLQPGGGCWSFETCRPGSTFYDDSVTNADSPAGQGGIFDFSNQSNPFRDYTIVYAPSCTGDVHWGDQVQTYRSGDERLTIRHKGFVNASTALRWAYRAVPRPRSVFVAGCSAGSVGSAAFAPFLIRHYRRARVAQLGDSLAFVFHRPLDLETDYRAHENFPRWIPAVRAIKPGEFTMARYYAAIGSYYRRASLAQFNYAADAVQERYYVALGGRPGDFPAALAKSLGRIRASTRNFRSYTAPGSSHCVLPLDRFYDLRVGGVSFAGWVARLAAGRPVRSTPPTGSRSTRSALPTIAFTHSPP
jgi:Pectinacetylesterase